MDYNSLLREDAVNNIIDFTNTNLPTTPVEGNNKLINDKTYTIVKVIS